MEFPHAATFGLPACGRMWALFLQVTFEAAARGILARHVIEFPHATTFGLVLYEWNFE